MKLSTEEILQEPLPAYIQVASKVSDNGTQRPDCQALVAGDRDVVFSSFDQRGQAYVASCLPNDFIAVAMKSRGQLCPGKVPPELQTAMTSSLTK